jgi:hypothetical protein
MTNSNPKAARIEPIGDSDPFDPVVLRKSLNYEAVNVRQEIGTLRVQKPPKQEHVRVHPSEDYRAEAPLLELKEEREHYLVHPAMQAELEEEIIPVRLYLAIGRSGVPFLWPIRLAGPDGKRNPWHESAEHIAQRGMERWVRLVAKPGAGMYVPLIGSATLPEPDWPELPSMRDLLRLAFGDRLIDTTDHPVVRKLRGLT